MVRISIDSLATVVAPVVILPALGFTVGGVGGGTVAAVWQSAVYGGSTTGNGSPWFNRIRSQKVNMIYII